MEEEASEEQGIKKEKDSEEKKKDMDLGESDEDVYSDEGREKLVDDDEISPQEEAFMEGAKDAGHKKGHVRGDSDEELEE